MKKVQHVLFKINVDAIGLKKRNSEQVLETWPTLCRSREVDWGNSELKNEIELVRVDDD